MYPGDSSWFYGGTCAVAGTGNIVGISAIGVVGNPGGARAGNTLDELISLSDILWSNAAP